MKQYMLDVTKLIALIGLLFALQGNNQQALAQEKFGRVYFKCQNEVNTIRTEIAADNASRSRGLMHRTFLAEKSGMLFLFPASQEVTMWMKDTPLSLDMIFIDETGLVINIAEKTTPLSTKLIPSGGKVRAVLEVVAGTAERLNWQRGCTIQLEYPIK